jgi:hypothetical protein
MNLFTTVPFASNYFMLTNHLWDTYAAKFHNFFEFQTNFCSQLISGFHVKSGSQTFLGLLIVNGSQFLSGLHLDHGSYNFFGFQKGHGLKDSDGLHRRYDSHVRFGFLTHLDSHFLIGPHAGFSSQIISGLL